MTLPAPSLDEAQPQKHQLLQSAVRKELLNSVFPQIQAAFAPQVVRYGNTNPNINKSDGSHGASVEWKVSCYMEVSHDGGAMQKDVQPSAEMLHVCKPLLERADAAFTEFYTRLHGKRSIRKLVRMQSFVTRYRPGAQEAGLLRHIDGAHVDGSLILALSGADGTGAPIDVPFGGGGVTVWEKRSGVEHAFEYPMLAGDVCALDNYVWHQGNPIHSGERWALVIFYQTKGDEKRQHRLAHIVLNMARQVREDEAHKAVAAARAAAASDAAATSATDRKSSAAEQGAVRGARGARWAIGTLLALAVVVTLRRPVR
jgi:hypothetical protein